MTATEYVVLVDENDHEIGRAEKMAAHEKCLLHRAFSIFIFSAESPKKLLLQQRALSKYHSPGLWTNTCCSHPRVGEEVIAAGERRLKEELGFTVPLKTVGWFHYTAHFGNGLSENEVDHVLVGTLSEGKRIEFNTDEVHATRWVTLEELHQELTAASERFTPWLTEALRWVE